MAKIIKIIGAFDVCPPSDSSLHVMNINADLVIYIYEHEYKGTKTGFTVLSLVSCERNIYTKTSLAEVLKLISD